MSNTAGARIPIFQERFRKLVDERGGVSEMSRITGISRPTINFWYNGQRTPDAENLITLSDKLGVSINWMLGKSDVPSLDSDFSTACNYFGLSETAAKNLRYIKENGGTNLKYINLLLSVRGFHYALDYIGKAVAMYEKRKKEAGDNIESYEQMERSFDALTDHFNYFNLQKDSPVSGTLSPKRFISFYKQEAINIIQHLIDCIVDGRIK